MLLGPAGKLQAISLGAALKYVWYLWLAQFTGYPQGPAGDGVLNAKTLADTHQPCCDALSAHGPLLQVSLHLGKALAL